jgi:hypothetical protein
MMNMVGSGKSMKDANLKSPLMYCGDADCEGVDSCTCRAVGKYTTVQVTVKSHHKQAIIDYAKKLNSRKASNRG